ncbi:hypothetical protein [Gloeothece verrucosa]|uniref:Type II secretion system protein GspC N-terminal domain-containing protein n=1 Tax=Gloeothece verrucosa (strain PCC 7822) TaxID=497965 RepID=E0UB02_GLOV7|nr:hypothetical protein [Gloeothece verrucosa]ADN15124.1 conserved hypothetical protein [Gloeothece verrucosa PCC 7822]
MTSHLNGKKNIKLSFDKILFVIACTYLMMVIFGLVSQGKPKLAGTANSSAQPSNPNPTLSPDDARFIAYLQQSLEILERKQQQQKAIHQPTSNHSGTQPIKVPSPPLPLNPSSTTPTTPRIVEKIYIPVYPQMQPIQQPSAAINSPPVIALKPSSSSLSRSLVPPPPPPTVPTPPSIQPVKPPSTVPVLTPGVSLVPQTPPPLSSPSSNGGGNLLVGLLEAGDKSSALITIDGQTQRIQVGESIGTSGWTLKAVENQQVMITRNGTVRRLGVGQSF